MLHSVFMSILRSAFRVRRIEEEGRQDQKGSHLARVAAITTGTTLFVRHVRKPCVGPGNTRKLLGERKSMQLSSKVKTIWEKELLGCGIYAWVG